MSYDTTHHFSVREAVEHGVDSAILLQNIRFWLQKNKANMVNVFDGYIWTYNSSKAFVLLHPYMSDRSISRHLKDLCDKGVLLSGNYNKVPFDRTTWYTIPSEFSISHSDISISQNGYSISQNGYSISRNDICVSKDGEHDRQDGELDSSNWRITTASLSKGIRQSDATIPDVFTDINTDVNQIETADVNTDDGAKHVSPPTTATSHAEKFDWRTFDPPDFIDRLTWDDWMASRAKNKKSSMSKATLIRLVGKLAKARDEGLDVSQAMEAAIDSGWTGFEVEWARERQKANPKPRAFTYIPSNQPVGNVYDGEVVQELEGVINALQ